MSKYDKFVIYKIYQEEVPDMIYIGSTTNFSQRKSNHKKYCNCKTSRKYRYPLYRYIRACGGWEKFKMIIIENYPCKTKEDGLTKEKQLIEFYGAKLNTIKPIKNV